MVFEDITRISQELIPVSMQHLLDCYNTPKRELSTLLYLESTCSTPENALADDCYDRSATVMTLISST